MENKKNDFNLGSGTLRLPNGRVVEVHDAWLTEEPVPADLAKPVSGSCRISLPSMDWPANAKRDVLAFLEVYGRPQRETRRGGAR